MSDALNIPTASSSVAVETTPSPYIDWAAVFAGALVGIAIVATLTSFGSAIGLSLTSPYLGRGFNGYGTAVAVAIWTMWVVISGHFAAGYIAGRMRHTTVEAGPDEAEIRNGVHGLVAWAIATIIITLLVAFTVLGGESARKNSATGNEDRAAQVADQLLRGAEPNATYSEGLHREVATILRSSVYTGKISADDRNYLVSIAGRGGHADAAQRVDAAITDVKEHADNLRKVGVLVGFLTAASLAVGAAAAWWAERVGGAHRLNYRGLSVFTRWS